MSRSSNNWVLKPQPSQPTKPTTLLALEPLTRLEVDALRQKKKSISDYYQKVLASKV